MRFDDVLRCDVVLPLMFFSYEFWYVAGACGLMMCWCGGDDKIGLLLSS